jgi:hypothetical protein
MYSGKKQLVMWGEYLMRHLERRISQDVIDKFS